MDHIVHFSKHRLANLRDGIAAVATPGHIKRLMNGREAQLPTCAKPSLEL